MSSLFLMTIVPVSVMRYATISPGFKFNSFATSSIIVVLFPVDNLEVPINFNIILPVIYNTLITYICYEGYST